MLIRGARREARWQLGPIFGLLLAAGSVTLVTGGLGTQEVPKGAHGAASMEHQSKLLAVLQGDLDVEKTPKGLDAVVWEASIPEDNAPTKERVELGRELYFDTRLSADDSVSCATCHDVTRGLTDQRPVSEGIRDKLGRRNAPTTFNMALVSPLFWDGRARSLEHQAGMPILNPIEMGMPDKETVVKKLLAIPEYAEAFQRAYGRPVNYEDIERAIAAFERTLVFIDAPFDRFVAGDGDAISVDAQKGWTLFNGKGRCVTCHPMNSSNPLGTDNMFHNIGVSARTQNFESLAKKALEVLEKDASETSLDALALTTDMTELGRFIVTKHRPDIGSFKTPQLRNIGITGPYMHDGTQQTLWDVLDHYNKGGEDNPYLDGGIEALALTEDEIDQLVAFMFTLTDDRFAEPNAQRLREQSARKSRTRPFRDTALANRQKIGFETRVLGKEEKK